MHDMLNVDFHFHVTYCNVASDTCCDQAEEPEPMVPTEIASPS